MKIYVYPTDHDWFEYLAQRPNTDEVNFWRPGGVQPFQQLQTGELLLFRLKGNINKIAGGGIFLRFGLQSIAAAWSAFGDKNGLPDYATFRRTLAKHKEDDPSRPIGCGEVRVCNGASQRRVQASAVLRQQVLRSAQDDGQTG